MIYSYIKESEGGLRLHKVKFISGRNIWDHKRRLLTARLNMNWEESFIKPFAKISIFVVICGKNIVLSVQVAKKDFLCTSTKLMYLHGSPSFPIWVLPNFSYSFSWISISRSFDGNKEIVLVGPSHSSYTSALRIKVVRFHSIRNSIFRLCLYC